MNIKHLKLNIQKKLFHEFIEKEINLNQYDSFELHFCSSIEKFEDYITQECFIIFEMMKEML